MARLIDADELVDTLADQIKANESDTSASGMAAKEVLKGFIGLVNGQPTASDWNRYSTALWREAYERGKRDAQAEVAKDINVPSTDCISRQAAIEFLMDNMAWYSEEGCEASEDEKRDAITELINGVPAAQPTQTNTESTLKCVGPTQDCVSRQEAIDAADKIIERDTSGNNDVVKAMTAWKEYIKGLPTAQPEQTDCDYCHENFDGYVKPIEKNSHAFIYFGMNGWELNLRAKGWHGSAKIMYCPMCGRRLERG